ncbi:MAG: sigma-54 dependent transcriptional regulator [Thermoanaerobaculia bacterium]
MISILVVDDSKDAIELILRILKTENYRIYSSESAIEAIQILKNFPVDILITDLRMPEVDGMQLLKFVRENYKNIGVIMITGYPSIGGAVEAIQMGADEYLPKPFTKEELLKAIEKTKEKVKARKIQTEEALSPFYGIVGESKPMKIVYNLILKSSKTDAPVLITGESGTGKELVARAIHYLSKRNHFPFLPVNCSAIPETLIESELFGYAKGAFTDAKNRRLGLFQSANGGTIFLDEISEISAQVQVKLLRVLQDGEVYMIGTRKAQNVDVRVISATNKDLSNLVENGFFRRDLFFRLNVIRIDIPPLRERGDDILLLIKHFSTKFAKEMGKEPPFFSEKVIEAFKSYSWPGNIRELENVLKMMIIMSDKNTIEVSDLPVNFKTSKIYQTFPLQTLEEFEAKYIKYVLSHTKGNKSKAASILGLDRKTLRMKIKKYGIEI